MGFVYGLAFNLDIELGFVVMCYILYDEALVFCKGQNMYLTQDIKIGKASPSFDINLARFFSFQQT